MNHIYFDFREASLFFLKLKNTFGFWVKKSPNSFELGLKEGGDLLFHSSSTIGANGLNFSVRKGKR